MDKIHDAPTSQSEATADTLAAALEREHHEIDRGIEAFLVGRAEGQPQTEPLARAIEALRRHIFLEEHFVFPPLRDAGLVAPIFVMLREHGEIWDTLDVLDAQLIANPDAAAMSEICDKLLEQLARHNAKEEPILYSQTDAVLTTAAGADLRAFLAAGRRPDRWVCAQAGTGPGTAVGVIDR